MVSEAQPSGYEDVEEELLSGSIVSEAQHSGYEDVEEELLSGESAKEDPAESYDDVITAGQISVSVEEDVAEGYDDVITADQSSAVVTEDMTDNYDDAVTGPNSNIMMSKVRALGWGGQYLQSLWGRGGESFSAAELNRLCVCQRKMDSCVVLILLSSTITLSTAGHTGARLVNDLDSCFWSSGAPVPSVPLWHYMRGVYGCLEGWSVRGRWRCTSGRTGGEFSWTPGVGSVASVVCRQLGCGSVFSFSSSSPSSPEHSQMCVTGFNCSASEAHLGNCSSAQAINCSSREQLSVTCSGKFNSAHSSIRLVGSGGDCAGRLEVFHSGSWGTVSDDLWDTEDAQVVCKQLQCGVALSAPVPAQFGPGTGPIWLNEVECEGNEAFLWNCRFQLCGENECGHKDDVGVVCSEYKEIRLTEGCEGNLEVFYNGSWGNVCLNGMTDETVGVVCRELNCGSSGSESWGRARVESAPNWLDDLKCRKHDSTLWHCPSSPWGQNYCDNSNEVARITCSGRPVVLILFGNLSRMYRGGRYVQQSSLSCSLSPHQRLCTNHLPLRLSGGEGSCSGRLELYHNNQWGFVCDDLWDIRDAQVVCRQLGCGPALSADGSSVFGAGEGPVWLNRVKCRGNEIHLWDCPHSLKSHTDCSHRQPVGVTCA
ncbi:hypothetical protein NFI96_027341, partial [Prochilodus magdalenae]